MCSRKKQKLEGMLRAVKDIKNEYYVGTQTAYKIIKRISRIYDNPEKVAIRLNHQLRQRFEKPSYETSPERAMGLADELDEATSTDLGEEFIYESCKLEEEMGFGIEFISDSKWIIEPLVLAKVLSPYFINANEEGVDSNSGFGEFVYDYCDNKIQRIFNEIQVTDKDEIWKNSFLEHLEGIDWEYKLSKTRFNKEQRAEVHSNMTFGIWTHEVVDRLIKDRYDHRLEYRRQVLCSWLEGIKSYEEAMKRIEESWRRSINHLKKMELMNVPQVILEDARKQIQSKKFIRHVLGSERNFVRKFLRN